jgi:hypothetical protein
VAEVKFPGPDDRVYIVGRTGSGKSTAGVWHLTGKDFDAQPWVLVNTKGDSFLNAVASIPGVKHLEIWETPGDKGLYHVRPHPRDEPDELDAFLARIWDKGNTGVFIDEGYMIENDTALNALLTQGRDKHIPMIVLTQRPTWITKFVESEADFVQLFQLTRRDDRKNVGGLVPVDKNYRLAPYCSYWYTVATDELVQFGPVPDKPAILRLLRAKFPPEQAQQGAESYPVLRRKVTARVI